MQATETERSSTGPGAEGLTAARTVAPASLLDGKVIYRTVGPKELHTDDSAAVSQRSPRSGKWPKTFPPLTEEQKRISDDFMKAWHEVLPQKYGVIEKFNHGYP